MNELRQTPRRAALLGVVGALGLLLVAGSMPADAGDRPSRSRTHHTRVQRTDTGHTRRDVWTNDRGKVVTRDATVVRDREARTRSRDVVLTRPDGKTRTLSDELTRTESGYTRETDVTRFNGSTTSRDVTASYDPETKEWSRTIEVQHTPSK